MQKNKITITEQKDGSFSIVVSRFGLEFFGTRNTIDEVARAVSATWGKAAKEKAASEAVKKP